jgi:hypothetical protein
MPTQPPFTISPQFKAGNRAKAWSIVLVCCIPMLLVIGSANTMATAAAQTATPRPESSRTSSIPLNPDAGTDIGAVYEAYMSPQQEGGEEADTPALIPAEFRSTSPSISRNQRPDRGHAVIEFNKELSKVYVHLAIKNIKVDDINMLHIHCGRPGQLGPILIDFSMIGNINSYLADGTLNVEVTNEDIVASAAMGSNPLVSAFTSGCPIVQTIPNDRVKTIAGMELIARQGELYFNLHTKAQTYYSRFAR